MNEAFIEVSNAVNNALKEWIIERHKLTGESKRLLSIVAGEALIMTGCTFIGPALDIKDPVIGMQPGKDCIGKLHKLAEVKS